MSAPSSSASVAILLSTFNGADYLREQLASFDAQRGVTWCLYWRDDGSDDESADILRSYAGTRSHCRHVEAGRHLGVTGSYMALLAAALDGGAAFVAFADQDDVWMPGKLARAMAEITRAGQGAPTLYCSRQVLVGEQLQLLGVSAPFRVPPGLCPALTQNIATGCTVVLNRDAARLVVGSTPPSASLHDWWSYLVVAGSGGIVLADAEPTVRYRQHAANAVGAPLSKRRRAMAALRRGPGAYMKLLRDHVTALRAQSALLSPEGRRAVDTIGTALESGVAARLRVLWQFPLLRQTRAETWLFRCWFLLG